MGYTSGCLGSVVQNDYLTAAWAEGVVNAGGTVSPFRRSTVDTLIKGLRADGVLTKLDRLWLLAAENTQSALLDAITRTTAKAVGSPTFTANTGYAGVDASSTVYIDSNTNGNALINCVPTSCHFSIWCNTNPLSGPSGGASFGCHSSTPASFSQLYPNYNTNLTFFRCNSNSALGGQTASGAIGHFLCNRPGGGGEAGYINGSQDNTHPASGAGSAFPSGNFIVLADNEVDGSGVLSGNAAQISAVSIGGGLTDPDIANLYKRLRTYMTTLGLA